MESYGSLIAQIYTSQAQIPVAGATVAVTQPTQDGQHKLIALRVTDKNGKIAPIQIATPPISQSLSPSTADVHPYAQYDLWVQATGYEVTRIENTQVFPQVETIQKVELIPLPEYTPLRVRGEVFPIPPQNL